MQCFEVGDKVILLMRPVLSLMLHMCENIEQIMHYSWNNCLIYKKIKIFYIQKSTVHYVTLILDDPLYISNFDTRKVMSFFFNTCMYLLFAHYIYYVYIPWLEKKATLSENYYLFIYLNCNCLSINTYFIIIFFNLPLVIFWLGIWYDGEVDCKSGVVHVSEL